MVSSEPSHNMGMQEGIIACTEGKLQAGMALGFPGDPRAVMVAENQTY